MKYDIGKITTPKGAVKYELRYSLGRGAERENKTRRFDTKREAQNHIDDVINELASEKQKAEERKRLGVSEDEDRTWDTELAYWQKHEGPTHSPSYKKTTDAFASELSKYLSGKKVYSINAQLLDEIASELRLPRTVPAPMPRKDRVKQRAEYERLKPMRTVPGNSDRTVWSKLSWIQTVLNFSVERQRIRYSPIAKYRKQKPKDPVIEFWREDDAADFLRFANERYPRGSAKRWVFVAYMTALNTGLRAGELWAIKPRCLRPADKVLRIDEQWDRVKKDFGPLKGREPFRNVPLNSALQEELELLISSGGIGRNSVIFNAEGSVIDHDNFTDRQLARDLRDWQGPVIKFHGLRHTAATLMLAGGTDLKTVSSILGHKDIAITSRYLHLIDSKVGETAERFAVLPTAASAPKLRVV